MAGRVQPRQLAFALPHAESLTRDNFLEGPANASGLALVDSWPEWPNRVMLMVGPEGSGPGRSEGSAPAGTERRRGGAGGQDPDEASGSPEATDRGE